MEATRHELVVSVTSTWTPKVCRIIAFYGYWAIILPTFGGLGRDYMITNTGGLDLGSCSVSLPIQGSMAAHNQRLATAMLVGYATCTYKYDVAALI